MFTQPIRTVKWLVKEVELAIKNAQKGKGCCQHCKGSGVTSGRYLMDRYGDIDEEEATVQPIAVQRHHRQMRGQGAKKNNALKESDLIGLGVRVL